MAAEQQAGMEPGIGLPSAQMRITQGGKIRTWVEFALKIFEVCISPVIIMLHNERCMDAQENEERALVLHTLPTTAKTKSKENERIEVDAGDGSEPQPQDAPKPQQGVVDVAEGKRSLSASTTTIPRLISVVEIIKREYLVAMNAKRSVDLVGLYQYNEMGSLEDRVENERKEGEESVEDRAKMITEALNGTKRYGLPTSISALC